MTLTWNGKPFDWVNVGWFAALHLGALLAPWTFTWTGLSTADFYQLEVYDATDTLVYSQWFTSGICTGLDCAVSPAETLNLANGGYKWRVRTYGSSGFTAWTPYMNFTLNG